MDPEGLEGVIPVADEAPSLGEISRAVMRLEREISAVRSDLKTLPDKSMIEDMRSYVNATIAASEVKLTGTLDLLRRDVEAVRVAAAAEVAAQRTRVDDLEAWKTWVLRIVVGAVIAALLAVVIVSGGVSK